MNAEEAQELRVQGRYEEETEKGRQEGRKQGRLEPTGSKEGRGMQREKERNRSI